MAWYKWDEMQVKVDSAGRIVLPKPLRIRFGLKAGDTLELESSDVGLTLRPTQKRVSLQQQDGVWIFHSGHPLSAETVRETLERTREEREASVLAPLKE